MEKWKKSDSAQWNKSHSLKMKCQEVSVKHFFYLDQCWQCQIKKFDWGYLIFCRFVRKNVCKKMEKSVTLIWIPQDWWWIPQDGWLNPITQTEVIHSFGEKYPDLLPILESTISKMEKQFREIRYLRKTKQNHCQRALNEIVKTNAHPSVEENLVRSSLHNDNPTGTNG